MEVLLKMVDKGNEKVVYKYSGIDTVELVTSRVETETGKKIYTDEMEKHRIVMIDKVKYVEGGKVKFPIKPSKDSINDLSTKKEVEDAIKLLESKIGDEFSINRVDVTVDFVGSTIKEMEKIGRVYLETLSLVRGGEMMFQTLKKITEIGNMKIRKDRRSTTIYNCEDRPRLTNVRLEQRFSDLDRTEEEVSIKIEKVISAILKELKTIESKFEKVENLYIEKLSKVYDKEITEGLIRSFTDFVMKYNSVILTKNILGGLYKHSKLKGNFNGWLKKYRKTRKLELIKKSDFKKLVKELKKEYKSILKS